MARYGLLKAAGIVSIVVLAMTLAASAQIPNSATMVNFNGYNGTLPVTLIQATDGNFYGTTNYGGASDFGTIYAVTPYGVSRNNQSVLYNFTNGPDGGFPNGSLLQAIDGNLYGTTYQGGNGICYNGNKQVGCGTIFSFNLSTGALTTLHTFSWVGQDGRTPIGGLTQDPATGYLFGTTSRGGANNLGTVFRVQPDGSNYEILYSFGSSVVLGKYVDGTTPYAGVTKDGNGNLWGTTGYGGFFSGGVVFELVYNSAKDTYSLGTVFAFSGSGGPHPGAVPNAPLVFGPDGNLYGTTWWGGVNNLGAVFKVNIQTLPPTFKSLYSFSGGNDGAHPYAPLMLASDGYFYGTTQYGGAINLGTIFRVDNQGGFTGITPVIYSFAGGADDGANPVGGLIQATNGYFYGTASNGGYYHSGTVFALSPARQRFVSVTPCRLTDTRSGNPLAADDIANFNIQELAATQCGYDLSHASSYALNVTIAPTYGPVGYLTLYPANSPKGVPVTSVMNSYNQVTKAAFPIVQGGWAGKPGAGVGIYSSDKTDVILDLQGYFVEEGGMQFYPMTACRVVDTRHSNGPLGGPFLTGNVIRQFPMMVSSCFAGLGGVPPEAYSLNLTVIPHENLLGYLTAWPGGQPKPDVSNLNDLTPNPMANAAIIPAGAGADGSIEVYASNDTDVIIDVFGYFNPPGANGYNYYPGLPCRAVDTRSTTGAFNGLYEANVGASICAPPSLLLPAAYDLNSTVVPNGFMGYLTLWPAGMGMPIVSTLNAYDGTPTSNAAMVVNTNNVGVINAYATGSTNLIIDLNGYFGPTF